MAASISTFKREAFIYTEAQLNTVKELAQSKFEANPDERIIKLSRRIHPDLKHSIYAVKNAFDQTSYHAHVHKGDDPSKASCGFGGYKTSYLIPNIEDATCRTDKVRLRWRPPCFVSDTMPDMYQELLPQLDTLPKEKRELLAIDGLVRVDSKRAEQESILSGVVQQEIFLIAPYAGERLKEYLEKNKAFLTIEQKTDLVMNFLKAVDALCSISFQHNDLCHLNVMIQAVSPDEFKVSLIDFDEVGPLGKTPEWARGSADWTTCLSSIGRKIFTDVEFAEFIRRDFSGCGFSEQMWNALLDKIEVAKLNFPTSAK